MTSIALDKDGLVAYDSRVTVNGTILDDNFNKHIKRNGVHYFICGCPADAEFLISAVEGRQQDSYPDTLDVYAIIYKDGRFCTAGIGSAEGYYFQEERKGCSLAAGSGEKHLLTAMDMGADAKEAVRMAIKRDSSSGGRIRTMQF